MKRTSRACAVIVRCLLLATLTGCGGSAVDEWVARLDVPDLQQRRAAAEQLAAMNGTSQPLIAALATASTNGDAEVREIAVAALGRKGGESDVVYPALQQALGDAEVAVRLKAALAILPIEPANQASRDVLVESLRAGHGTVFLDVGRMGAKAEWAVPTLVARLSDQRPSIRALAAKTLGEIGTTDADAIAALKRHLGDQEASVRHAAARALEQLQQRPPASTS